MDEKDTMQTTNDVAENNDNAETHSAKGLICAFLDKYIGGIKEYVSLFTFVTTIGAAVCGAVMRFCVYLYYYGYTRYWNLPKEIIDVKSNNFIFEFIINAIIIVFIMIINKFYYDSLKKHRKFWKLLVMGFVYLAISVLLYSISQKYPIAILIYLLITVLLLPAYSMTIADTFPNPIKAIKKKFCNFVKKIKNCKFVKWICKKRNKKKQKNKAIQQEESSNQKVETVQQEKNQNNQKSRSISFEEIKDIVKIVVVIFFIISPIIMFGTIGLGYQEASHETSFRVIETSVSENEEKVETFAIIYETNDSYYISPCIMNEDKITDIKKETQNIISKEGIEYTHSKYEKKNV